MFTNENKICTQTYLLVNSWFLPTISKPSENLSLARM